MFQGERFTCNYSRNGIVKLQINGFTAADVGTYECVAHNDYGDMAQPVIAVMAQYPEFIKSPTGLAPPIPFSLLFLVIWGTNQWSLSLEGPFELT